MITDQIEADRTAAVRPEENRQPAWQLIAEREILAKLRDKTFLGGTVFMLLLVLGSIVIPSLISGRDEPDEVAVVDDAAVRIVQRADAAAGGETFAVRRVAGAVEAEQLVADGTVKVALVPNRDGYTMIGDENVPANIKTGLREALTQERMERNAERAGLTPEQLRAGSQLTERLLDPGPLPEVVAELVDIGLAVAFYATALGFGMMIAQSVVQEKESRVVEILAAAVPIRALLWGKVLGNTFLALVQILVIAVGAVIALAVTGKGEILEVIAPVSGWFVLYFVLGFVALAGLWAVAGSLATRQEDLQATTLPGQMLLAIPFFFSVFAGEQAKAIASFVPIVSSMAMPGRMLTGDVPLWQPLVSIALLLLATVLLVRLGARLYERTLLQTGRRMGYREALRQ